MMTFCTTGEYIMTFWHKNVVKVKLCKFQHETVILQILPSVRTDQDSGGGCPRHL